MDRTWLEKSRVLRDDAWEAVKSSDAYIAFKALDDAVVRMGGSSIAPVPAGANPFADLVNRTVESASRRMVEGKRIAHGDAAELALREKRVPLPIGLLLEAAASHGAEIGGTEPLNNFRSTVSKDPRFRSVRRGNMYFWWLTGESMPPSWVEAEGPDLLAEPSASSSLSSQEGGGGHGPATT